jgi:hypothetical protein
MAENVPGNEGMLARILLNQRMILEQNKKLLDERRQTREEERERDTSNDKIPLVVKVYVSRFIGFCFCCTKNKSLLDRQCYLAQK